MPYEKFKSSKMVVNCQISAYNTIYKFFKHFFSISSIQIFS